MYLRLNAFFSFPNVYYWRVSFPFYSDSHFPFLYSRGHIILPYRVNGSFMLYFKTRNGKKLLETRRKIYCTHRLKWIGNKQFWRHSYPVWWELSLLTLFVSSSNNTKNINTSMTAYSTLLFQNPNPSCLYTTELQEIPVGKSSLVAQISHCLKECQKLDRF